MATVIHLDSIMRDRYSYPNPAAYTVDDGGVASWSTRPVLVRSTPADRRVLPADMIKSVRVTNIRTPYAAALLAEPLLYLNLHTIDHRGDGIINTIDGFNSDARFILSRGEIISDAASVPRWIAWYASGERTYPFSFGKPIALRFFLRTGTDVLFVDAPPGSEPDPLAQTYVTLEVMPISRDGDYTDGAGYTDYTD